jgi:hypothetical protein
MTISRYIKLLFRTLVAYFKYRDYVAVTGFSMAGVKNPMGFYVTISHNYLTEGGGYVKKGKSLPECAGLDFSFTEWKIKAAIKAGLLVTRKEYAAGVGYNPASTVISRTDKLGWYKVLRRPANPRDENSDNPKVRYPVGVTYNKDDKALLGDGVGDEVVFSRVRMELERLHEIGVGHGFKDPFFVDFQDWNQPN